jgi:hypothetical protein
MMTIEEFEMLVGLATVILFGSQSIPPPEFDKPYEGRLIQQIVDTDEELARYCGPIVPGYNRYGCAYVLPKWNLCVIYMLPGDILHARGVSLSEVLRHELGHCNGWKHEER